MHLMKEDLVSRNKLLSKVPLSSQVLSSASRVGHGSFSPWVLDLRVACSFPGHCKRPEASPLRLCAAVEKAANDVLCGSWA